MRQIRHGPHTVSLDIESAQVQNSGTYVCKLFTEFGETTNKALEIQVIEKSKFSLYKFISLSAYRITLISVPEDKPVLSRR